MHPLSWGPDLAGAGAVEDEEGGGRAPASSGNLLAPPFISQSLLPLALPLFLLGVGDALASLSALTPWRRLGDALASLSALTPRRRLGDALRTMVLRLAC